MTRDGSILAPARPLGVRTLALIGAGAGVSLVVAHALDPLVHEHVRTRDVYGDDLGRAFRVAGFVPLWLVVALGMLLIDARTRRAGGWRAVGERAYLLSASVISSGLVAELIKLLSRRLRPDDDLVYRFRPFDDATWSTGGIGFVSSHAAVAFGAAFVLCRLAPRLAPIWLLLGIGCGVTRLLDGAHWLSDVVGAAIVALLCVETVARTHRRPDAYDPPTGDQP
ncbi:MAG: phosphatase PAP2 family protein [Planctomycetota bacterium]